MLICGFYQNRLDEVCGLEWSVTYTPWSDRVICHLTINSITRSSTGEADSQAEKSEIAGTAAEAQAFKRACGMFGLGRYLYGLPTLWVDYDAQAHQFTAQGQAKLKGMLVQHYQRVSSDDFTETEAPDPTDEDTNDVLVQLWQQFDELGNELYGGRWAEVSRHNVERVTEGATDDPEDLTAAQLQTLIVGMETIKRQRKPTRSKRPVKQKA